MTTADISNPILNSPYDPPEAHFEIGPNGPTGSVLPGRRPSESFIPVPPSRKGREAEQQALDFDYRPGKGVSPSGSSRVPQGALRIPEDPNNPGHPLCGTALCTAMTTQLGWSVDQRYIRNTGPSAGTTAARAKTAPG